MSSDLAPSRSKKILADLGLLYAAAIWGSTFFMVKSVLDQIDPVTLVAYRFLLAGGMLAAYLKFSGRQIFNQYSRGITLGVLLWMLYISQTIGLKYTTASNSAFITGLFVAFVPIFLIVIFKRRPSLAGVIASIVSLTGLWTLTGGMSTFNRGDLLTLAASVTYALHVLYSDKYMKAKVDPYVLCCQQFLVVGFLSLASCLVLGLSLEVSSSTAFRAVLFLSLFPTLSAFVVQLVAQKITPAIRVSLIFALEPVFGGLFAWTLGGESITRNSALGGLLIFASLVISGLPLSFSRKKHSR